MTYVLMLVAMLLLPATASAQTWPNEPAGFTLISDHNFTTCEANGWTGNCNQITSDATAPLSPTSVMRWVYSLSSGFGSGDLNIPINQTEIYIGYWFKLSNPFEGAANGSNKHTFGFDGTFGHGYWTKAVGPQGGGQFVMQFHLQGSNSSIDNCHILSGFGECFNRAWNGGTTITLGVWHRVELYYKHSTTQTSRNGIARLWLDGNLEISLTNLNTPSGPIQDLSMTATWTPPIDRSNADQVSFDHVHVSTCTGCATPPPPPPPTGGPPNAPTNLTVTRLFGALLRLIMGPLAHVGGLA